MIFRILPCSVQEMNHSVKQQVRVWQVWWLLIDWIDLPEFTTFITGGHSFTFTTSLCLSSCLIIDWSSWIHCIHYRNHSMKWKTLNWRVWFFLFCYQRYSKLKDTRYSTCFQLLRIESDWEWFAIFDSVNLIDASLFGDLPCVNRIPVEEW